MGFVDDFTQKIYSEFKVYAAYPPLQTIRPGDYGKLDGALWRRAGNIATMPDPVEPTPKFSRSARGGDVEWKTEGTIATRFDAGAHFEAGPATADAGFNISFKSQDEAYFWMPGVQYVEMSNLAEVMKGLVDRSTLDPHDPKYWDTDFCVVSAAYVTPNLTEVVSRGEKSDIQIEAKGEPNAIDLANANLTFQVTSTDSSSIHYISKLGTDDMSDVDEYYTVFIELVQVHYRLWARWWGQP